MSFVKGFLMFVRILLLAGLLVILPGLPQTIAQSPGPAGQVKAAEYDRKKMLESFRQWQKANPGYERQIYKRVKKVNSRTVRINNILIGGFVVLLIANAAILILLFSGRGEEGRGPLSDSKTGSRWQKIQIQGIVRRQRNLKKLIDKLANFYSETHQHSERLSQFVVDVDANLKKIGKEVDELMLGEEEKPGDKTPG